MTLTTERPNEESFTQSLILFSNPFHSVFVRLYFTPIPERLRLPSSSLVLRLQRIKKIVSRRIVHAAPRKNVAGHYLLF
jgi:hypothetical protein